jgi:hypothetical protein
MRYVEINGVLCQWRYKNSSDEGRTLTHSTQTKCRKNC